MVPPRTRPLAATVVGSVRLQMMPLDSHTVGDCHGMLGLRARSLSRLRAPTYGIRQLPQADSLAVAVSRATVCAKRH